MTCVEVRSLLTRITDHLQSQIFTGGPIVGRALPTKSNWTLVSFFGLSNSPLFLKKKVRVKFLEFRWFENKILVPIWSEVESIAIRLFN